MNGPLAPLRRSCPPRRPAVSVPDAGKKTSGACSTPMPPLHPRRLARYTDFNADTRLAVSDSSADILQHASPIYDEIAMAGSWTTMMFNETNVDEISLSTPLHDLDTQTKVTKAKRAGNYGAGNYTLDKDIQLCISWENISTDPIVSNEQPGRAYWQRIANHYHAHKSFESDRNSNSFEHRWSTIQKDCLKYQACYDDIERRHPSGIPYKEHILEAHAMFAKPPQKKPFQFIHCWLKVRHCQKFQSIETNKRLSSRSSTPSEGEEEREEGGISETPDATQPNLNKRPIGRKQANARLKTRGEPGPYKEAIEELILDKREQKKLREEEKKQKEERWKETRMFQHQKISLEREKLMWEQEQKLMFCDLSILDSDQKAYVLAMRAQIAAQKLATANGMFTGGFGDGSDAGLGTSSGASGSDVNGAL